MSKKQATRELRPNHLGLAPHMAVDCIRLYEHLTPSLQYLLHEAKRFQASYNFKYCWSKTARNAIELTTIQY